MINLLPPKERLSIELAKRNSVLRRYIELCLVSVVMLVVLVVGSHYYLVRQEVNVRKTAELNRAKIAELEPMQKKAQELSDTMNTIAALLARDVSFSSMLTDIGKLIPDGAVLTGLELSSVDTDAPLLISAQVENEQVAAVLRNNLASSQLFESAEIQSVVRKDSETAEQPEPSSEGSDDKPGENERYRYTATLQAYFKRQKVAQ